MKTAKTEEAKTVAKTNIPEICPHSGGLCDCGGHCRQYYNTKQKRKGVVEWKM